MNLLALLLSAAPIVPVQSWLEAPGVRWVALQSFPEHCEACKKAAPRWSTLKSKYERRGLRIVSIVERDPFLGCLDPGFKPHFVECDYYFDGVAKSWKLRAKSPTVFLWDWTGKMLVERGTIADVERKLRRAPSLPLAVIGAPKDLFARGRIGSRKIQQVRSCGRPDFTRSIGPPQTLGTGCV